MDMNRFLRFLGLKIIAIPLRLIDLGRFMPVRLHRVKAHFQGGIKKAGDALKREMTSELFGGRILRWWMELLLLLLDVLGVGEFYEIINDFLKWNSRPLTAEEEKLLRSIYGRTINYSRVRIDGLAVLGPRQYRFCYVSFYIINAWGKMQDSLLVHEMMHVWQYQHLGISYIPKALSAQYSLMKYDYGGKSALMEAKEEGKGLLDFNFEQQAEIITDYFLLKTGKYPHWGNATDNDLALYEHFASQVLFAKKSE